MIGRSRFSAAKFCRNVSVAALLVLFALPGKADEAESFPLGFGLFPPAQFPPESGDVIGFRFGIFASRNYNVSFLDIASLVNLVDGNLMGIEVAGLCNKICTSDGALQVAGICNICEMGFSGMQIAGIANMVDENFMGLQIGCFNVAETVDGAQIGVFNKGGAVRGVQIGAFNTATTLVGVQIGVINFIEDSSVPCLPVINAHF